MIVKRDQEIINMLDEFHIATTTQIHRLFFNNTSYRYTAKRLEYLFNNGHVKRTKSTIDNCFAYYTDKRPAQLHHDLIRTELYTCMKGHYNVLDWNNELAIDNIRPDAVCYISDHGVIFPVFVEVHLSNKFNIDKYISLVKNNDLKLIFGQMPRVLICTIRQLSVPSIGIKFKLVDLEMNGLESLFK